MCGDCGLALSLRPPENVRCEKGKGLKTRIKKQGIREFIATSSREHLQYNVKMSQKCPFHQSQALICKCFTSLIGSKYK